MAPVDSVLQPVEDRAAPQLLSGKTAEVLAAAPPQEVAQAVVMLAVAVVVVVTAML